MVLAATLCALGLLASAAQASGRTPSLIEYIQSSLAADQGLSQAERDAYLGAFRHGLAGYSGDILRAERLEGAQVLLRVVTEGSFDNANVERTVSIATEAYIAVSRGAAAEVVEGIALYGFRKDVGGDEIETWANGYRDCIRFGVPDYIAEDLVFNAVEHDWDHYTFNSLKWVLVEAAKAGYPMEEFHSMLMVEFLKGDGKRPGALGSEVMALFREAAARGEKPKAPAYEGSFIPKASRPVTKEPVAPVAPAAPAPALEKPAAPVPVAPVSPVDPVAPVAPVAPAPSEPARQDTQGPPPTSSTSGGGIIAKLESSWNSFIGAPYVWGGETRRGTDCSGFVQAVFGEAGVGLPRVSREPWKVGQDVPRGGLNKGDLVFFRTMGNRISHVGIVTDPGSGRFIHASSSRGVVYDKLSIRYYSARYAGARRVLSADALALLFGD